MKTLKVQISGLVQGVFFRAFIRDEAEKLGIKGYVRNLESGKVEVVIEGDGNAVRKMLEVCKGGSPHSKVRETEVEEISNQNFKEFKILHI